MGRVLELVFGFEDAAPKDVEELVDENETLQETEEVEQESWEEEQQQPKRMKRTSAYVAVFEEIMNEIIDHELELLSVEERQIFRAFSQLPYLSKYTLTRLIQRNPGQWHPISTMEKFKKETGEHGLLTSIKDLCTLSISRLSSSSSIIVKKEPSRSQPPEHDIIDLTLDSEDEDDTKPVPAGRSHSSPPAAPFDPSSFFFCDDESKLELKDALHRLTAPDLHALAKDFKCAKSGKSNKDDVITALFDHARGQAVISLDTPDPKGKGKAKNGSGDNFKQTTLKGFLKPKAQSRNQEQILLKRAVDKLGKCVRINPWFYNLVIRLHVIYYRSTEMAPKPFTPSLLATFKKRFYPQYTHNRSIIWPTRDELLEYERALQLQQLMSEAEIADPDSDLDSDLQKSIKLKKKEKEKEKKEEAQGETTAATRSRAVLEIFERSQVEELWDACCASEKMKWHITRRPELERFQCGHILTRLVSKAAASCGPLREYDEELRLLNKLLGQKFWRRGKRAEWYRRRALVMTKKNDKVVLRKALEGIEEALHDPDTHLVLRPDLFERYKKLEARLKIPERLRCKVERVLREPVHVQFTGHRVYHSTQATTSMTTSQSKVATTSVSDKENLGGVGVDAELTSYFTKVVDPEKEEAARLISEGTTRSKPKWVGKSRWRGEGGGDVTVEELALQYYAKRGYNGFHSETRILTTIFALLFWDIIFENIPGAFETRFQAGPLDLAEDSFYYARKDAIEQRLKEIEAGNARKLVERHDNLYRERNTLCVGVRWDVCPPEDLVEVVECLKSETLITICRLFCEDYAARARGVPDLFVWDHEKRECKFVEVKGPGDRPSETQKLWFDTLLAAKADVEICSVIALTFKSVNRKRKRKPVKNREGPSERTEGKDEDEYQPASDDEEGGEHPKLLLSLRRSRSATLMRVEVEEENESGQGVLSTSSSQPPVISMGWPLEVEAELDDVVLPSPCKKRRTI